MAAATDESALNWPDAIDNKLRVGADCTRLAEGAYATRRASPKFGERPKLIPFGPPDQDAKCLQKHWPCIAFKRAGGRANSGAPQRGGH